MTPAGEVILKLFLRADLDVAEVAHLGAFLGLLDLREMLPAVEVRLLRLERIKENVTEVALVLICLTSLSVLLLRLAPHGDIARGSKHTIL